MSAAARTTTSRLGGRRSALLLALLALCAAGIAAVAALATSARAAGPLAGVDLSTYVRVGRFDLPEPTRTAAPANSLLAQEASGVAYNRDTDTLFITGDGGTSIVQVTKTGQLLDSMSLALGSSPQGTTFYDTEGLAYVGGGQFVITEERDRQVVRFTYAAGTTLTRAATQTVKLGTTIGNVGLEGVSNDPLTGGLILVKEKTPESIFQTGINWGAGTATNGSPSATASTDLFAPALVGTTDLSDVFALSNLPTLSGPEASNLLVISQESGKVVELDRNGAVLSSLTIQADAGNPLSVQDQTFEGLTMDDDGTLYLVNEAGGGDGAHPQLWVYKHSDAPNLAPTGLVLGNTVPSVPESASTQGGIRVADITVLDDGLGANALTVSGPDAASFQVIGASLYVKPGVTLDFETQTSYSVTVEVDDAAVGTAPDASVPFTLAVTNVVNETAAAGTVAITEVAPWSSGNSPVAADWFEVTNLGGSAIDLTGWKMDDNSFSAGSAVALRGVTSLPVGGTAIFLEGAAASTNDPVLIARFISNWYGAGGVPAGVQVGVYGGSGIGLSTGGDGVGLFNAAGSLVTAVSFGATGASAPYATLDNTAGIGSSTLPAPAISQFSSVGVNGAFQVTNALPTTVLVSEIGSPGRDFLPPVFSNTPFGLTAEATGASTAVPYAAPTATDLRDGAVAVTCTPASPGGFPIATTAVTCSAADAAGNTATTSFGVTVQDTSPPVLSVPGTVTVQATGALTTVSYGPVTATDIVDGPLAATCSPASGTQFAIGTTHVDCSVTDSHGNVGAALFNVVVSVAKFTVTPPAVSTSQDAAFAWSSLFFQRFTCSLDGAPAAACSSPRTYRSLAAGPHTLCVAATLDVQATCRSWLIVSPGKPVASILGVSTVGRSATATFTADQPATRFTCSLDGAAYRSCSSPLTYNGLAAGSHTLRVLSTNFAGDTSAAPALATFSIA